MLQKTRVFLVIFSIFLATVLSDCKARRGSSSTVQDYGIRDFNGLVNLYYLDKGTVFRAECGETAEPAKELNDQSYRDECTDITGQVPIDQFEKTLEKIYLDRLRIKKLTIGDRIILRRVIDHLRVGPNGQVGKTFGVQLEELTISDQQVEDRFISLIDVAISLDTPATTKQVKPSEPRSIPPSTTPGVLADQLVRGLPKDIFNMRLSLSGEVPIDALGIRLELSGKSGGACKALNINGVDAAVTTGDRSRWEPMAQSRDTSDFLKASVSLDKIPLVRVWFTVADQTSSEICRVKVIAVRSEENKKVTPAVDLIAMRNKVMRDYAGNRHHRLMHYLWHTSRNSWGRKDASINLKRYLTQLGWAPPRPLIYSDNDSVDYEATASTGAGEDFLHMHRSMIFNLKKVFSNNKIKNKKVPLPWYEPWKEIPFQANDPQFPIVFENLAIKTDTGFDRYVRARELWFTNPRNLENRPLSWIGTMLEYTIHNSLHNRFAAHSRTQRPFDAEPLYADPNSNGDVWKWDGDYDHLNDSYGAHVNPVFWQIHQWVDDRINDWLRANGKTSIEDKCGGASGCVEWQGNWDGPWQFKDPSQISQVSGQELPEPETLLELSRSSFMSTENSASLDKLLR